MKKMVAAALLVLVACGGSNVSAPPSQETLSGSAWRPPSSYRFDVSSKCGERSFIGHYRITVDEGQVTSAKALDESAQASLNHESAVPTLQDLLDEAENARRSGADVVESTRPQMEDRHTSRSTTKRTPSMTRPATRSLATRRNETTHLRAPWCLGALGYRPLRRSFATIGGLSYVYVKAG